MKRFNLRNPFLLQLGALSAPQQVFLKKEMVQQGSHITFESPEEPMLLCLKPVTVPGFSFLPSLGRREEEKQAGVSPRPRPAIG